MWKSLCVAFIFLYFIPSSDAAGETCSYCSLSEWLFKELRMAGEREPKADSPPSVNFPVHSAIQRAGNSPNPGELPAHTVPVRYLFEGREIPIEKQCFSYPENSKQQ